MRSRQVRVDTVCYNICIHACQGQWAQALGLFAELEGLLEPSEVSYGAVFVALGKGHRWLQVLAMLTSAVQGAKARVVYNTALGAFRDAHRWDLAIRMCEDPVVREHLDEVGWATVIAACAKAGKWSLGLLLTDQLRTHHKVTLQTYNWLLRGMRFDSGSWRAALSIVHDAMQKRLSPNAVTYTNLLHSWRQRGPWEKTLELFAELRQLDGAKAEAVSSVLAALERGHRLEATGVALDIKCFLRRQLKLGKAGFNNEAFHEAATLHSAWMGAGLPDAFGSAMHRVLVAATMRSFGELQPPERPLSEAAAYASPAKSQKEELQSAMLAVSQANNGHNAPESSAEEAARLRVVAMELRREKEELEAWKRSTLVDISGGGGVASAVEAAMALETCSVAKMRWKIATHRIINLIMKGEHKKQSLADRIKKSMNQSMLAKTADNAEGPPVLTRSRSNIVEPPRSLKQNILQGVPCLQRLVSGYPFELFFVFLIILNCGTMIAQIELTGQRLAYDIGVISTPIDTLDDFFWTAEFVFGICFAVEISFKFAAFGIVGFWKYAWNWMDLFV
ncbi:unnamed protein product, partial [Effrenium voratum]